MVEKVFCHDCGHSEFNCIDGFYYCQECGVQSSDMVETGVADEDLCNYDNHKGMYSQTRRRTIKSESGLSQSQTQGTFWDELKKSDNRDQIKQENSDWGPSKPNDFGSFRVSSQNAEDLASNLRLRYIMGIQLMIQFQCQALVEEFGASPLICGLSGVIWLRFVSVCGVFDEHWADKMIEDSEIQKEGVDSKKHRWEHKHELHNRHGQRAVIIWLRSLKKKIPLSFSLAVSFLACHIAREAILPTDIVKWSLENKLPYLSAFLKIGNLFDSSNTKFPLSIKFMFKPSQVVDSKMLESLSGSIAQRVGLELPPVNFEAISRRLLKQLLLPVEKILPCASLIHQWSMPPELWLSANQNRIPSRVCVMSILMVAIRVLYNINGFGKWEEKFSGVDVASSSHQVKRHKGTCMPPKKKISAKNCSQLSDPKVKSGKKSDGATKLHNTSTKRGRGSLHNQNPELDTAQLLSHLEASYEKTRDSPEYLRDLPTYLKYCRDLFGGPDPPGGDNRENDLIKDLWEIYENEEGSKEPAEAGTGSNNYCNQESAADLSMDDIKPTKPKYSSSSSPVDSKSDDDNPSPSSQEDQNPPFCSKSSLRTDRKATLKRLKSNMEESGFRYIPPRVNLKRFDYLHYVRKKDEGNLVYVAHADYYTLLRSCASVAQVDARFMHFAVLKFEKRLQWLENQIDRCLHLKARDNIPFKSDVVLDVDVETSQSKGNSFDLSKLKVNVDEESEDDINDSLDYSNYRFVI